jgi:hypothetical protein
MMKSLPKLLAMASLSAALALTGIMSTATPAQANNDNLRRFLGGAAAIIVLGSILENQRDRRIYAPAAPHGVAPHNQHRVAPYNPHAVAPHVPHLQRSLIAPSRCYSSFQGPHGVFRGFGAGCMQQSSAYYSQLPSACLQRVNTHQGWRNVYDAQCLYNRGWVRS